MTAPQRRSLSSLTVRADQPLIAVMDQQNGTDAIRYFTDEAEADEALGDAGIQQALSLAGAWKEIDSDDFLDELDRIRHQNKPTPPVELPELEP